MNFPSPAFIGVVGDIGATNARFSLVNAPLNTSERTSTNAAQNAPLLSHTLCLPTSEYANLAQALRAYFEQIEQAMPLHACIAIANPVDGDWLSMTNNRWSFSIEQTRLELGLTTLVMINDWEAIALSAPSYTETDLLPIGSGTALANAPRGLIGAGSGLGVSALVRASSGEWVAIAGEGGHVTFSPANSEETALLQVLWQRWPHISAERLISGMGLENLYAALTQMSQQTSSTGTEQTTTAQTSAASPLVAAEIVRRALGKQDALCEKTLEFFCIFLGRIAGNLALTLGARGGIYLGGGVVERLHEYLPQSGFRCAFEDKGRFNDYLERIPTWIITREHPGLHGAAIELCRRLSASPL